MYFSPISDTMGATYIHNNVWMDVAAWALSIGVTAAHPPADVWHVDYNMYVPDVV